MVAEQVFDPGLENLKMSITLCHSLLYRDYAGCHLN